MRQTQQELIAEYQDIQDRIEAFNTKIKQFTHDMRVEHGYAVEGDIVEYADGKEFKISQESYFTLEIKFGSEYLKAKKRNKDGNWSKREHALYSIENQPFWANWGISPFDLTREID